MRKLPLDRMKHRCTIRSGDMAGSDYVEDVSSTAIEYAIPCPNCDELLATPAQAIAYLYAQLTGE
jgi:hypothetical protein